MNSYIFKEAVHSVSQTSVILKVESLGKEKKGESIIGLNVENVGTNICIYHKKPLGWMNFYEHFSWFKFQIKSVCKIILSYY